VIKIKRAEIAGFVYVHVPWMCQASRAPPSRPAEVMPQSLKRLKSEEDNPAGVQWPEADESGADDVRGKPCRGSPYDRGRQGALGC